MFCLTKIEQQHKRRRTSETAEVEEMLEDLISTLGEEFFSFGNARLLPQKMTLYTTLVGLLNATNYNFGGEFVEAMIRQLKECMKVNLYNEAVYL
ncbi:hypothetical protein E2320_017106, partial [Naja naja]